MTQIQTTIRSMTWEEAQQYGLFDRGLMMNYGTVSYRLSAGTTDDIHAFKSSVVIYVLTINHHLNYLGLDAYIGAETEPIDSIFLEGDSSIKEFIGNNWHTLPPPSLATRLIQLFA